MENINLLTISGYACLAGLILIIVTPVFFFLIRFGMKKKQISNKVEAERQSILKNGGVIAPALIDTVTRKMGGKIGGRQINIIEFEVDVQPEGGVPFRANFTEVVDDTHFSMIGRELIGHSGRRIWVAYDPSNLSRVVLDHFDDQQDVANFNDRRAEFDKLTEGNEDLKKRGEAAEAVITRVDDLDLPYHSKKGRAKHLYFDVMPKTGIPFQAEGDFLIADSMAGKYSAGRKVFVRFDPLDNKKAVLDSERNKSLS